MFRYKRMTAALASTILCGALFALPAHAADTYSRITTIQIPGNPLTSFDISYVNQNTQVYVLSDRSNKAVDVFDAQNPSYLGRIGGFVGINTALGAAANNTAGPNGVAFAGDHEIWAGDGDSTVKVINLDTLSITDTIPTGGSYRADEMAYNARDQILAVVNDAEDITADPNSGPFITYISTKPDHKILGKIALHYATNGLEQTVWDAQTGFFYTAVPQIGADPTIGGVLKVDPKTLQPAGLFPVLNCQPHGLVQGPRQNLFLGCNAVTPAPTQQVINSRSGNLLATIGGIGGTDEAWFDPRTQRYFSAASSFPSGPILGIMDARNNTALQIITTVASAHSVAVNSRNGDVFVPYTPVATDTACSQGCISVFSAGGPPVL